MSDSTLLQIDGDVERTLALSFADLAAIDTRHQVADVSRLDAKRSGDAVRLAGLLELAGARPSARYITLHASSDDFHASIPLDAVRDRAILIYRLEQEPLPVKAGGPVRFFIPDFAACHTHEVDECANVKFVDRIELSAARGLDNRPEEERAHAELHRRQTEAGNS
jgi:DMSO/TMAO reductase YedYZ molybdopterin-dependent catalytic subunit